MSVPEIEKIEEFKKYSYVYSWLKDHHDAIFADLQPIDLELNFKNPVWLKIEQSYQQAGISTLHTPEGKMAIFSLLSSVVSLLMSVVMEYKSLPEPGVSSGNGLENLQIFSGDEKQTFDYVLNWLKGEQRYQLEKYGTGFSDKAINTSLDENNSLWQEMKMRYHRAGVLGLDIPNGRQALAKCASLGVAISAATVRNFGEF